MHFPSPLALDDLRTRWSTLLAEAHAAENAEGEEKWMEVITHLDLLSARVQGDSARASYRYSGDMTNAEAEAHDRYQREEIGPTHADGTFELIVLLVGSRHRAALEQRLGSYFFQRLDTSVQTLDPANREARIAVGTLGSQYARLLATATVEVRGEKMTMQQTAGLTGDPARSLREEAWRAIRAWVRDNRAQMASIFDELVRLRHGMAERLGLENYTPLGYAGMSRTDYGPEQAAQFRENVRRYAVPLLAAERRTHREELGLDTLRPWDLGYRPSLTLPRGIVPVESQLDTAAGIFQRLDPRLAGHFERMRRDALIDLPNHPGKGPGAYCTSFFDTEEVAIFCNSVGEADDVRVLLHEMGHAFQKWESASITPLALRNPTADLAEVHSMGMEYLSLPHIDLFFDPENSARFRRGRWLKAVGLLCYASGVDEFQHWVYDNPQAGPDERDAAWKRILDQYDPEVDSSGLDESSALRWYQQTHIFRTPFYYIDYAFAETGAMQLALMDRTDHEHAMNVYRRLCRLGGTLPVFAAYADAGFRSPLDSELMRELMEYAAAEIERSE